MNYARSLRVSVVGSVLCGLAWGALPRPVEAQGAEIKARFAEVSESMAKNRQQLAHYRWTEQDIISLKGEEKKEELFDVQLGPDGKPQKTNLDPDAMSDEERHRRGLRARIVKKKIDEYKEYADSMKNLMQQYVPPDKGLLEQAYQQGNVMIGPAGLPGEVRLVITNYVKPQDSMTLIFDKTKKRLLSLNIASHLDDPSDAVTLNVQFAALPDGTNHIAALIIDGIKKRLSVAMTNSNYESL